MTLNQKKIYTHDLFRIIIIKDLVTNDSDQPTSMRDMTKRFANFITAQSVSIIKRLDVSCKNSTGKKDIMARFTLQ